DIKINRQLNLSSYYEKEIRTFKEKAADNSNRQNEDVKDPVSEILPNAVAQKNAANAIETAKKKLLELKQ
ncbi:14330_t:CDS:2, partial [Cetraspora pellucida]